MKAVYRADEAAAWALFDEEPYLHVAGQGADGQPILRTFNMVVVDGALVFHAGGHGEKRELLNRPVVAQVERPLGTIPSYFVDPELACPATTYFQSAQARGVLREVTDLADKARYLAAFMRRHQPEGGHAPLSVEDPRYAAVLRGLWVAVLEPQRVVAKYKLGQNRSGAALAAIQRGLWQRGAPGDLVLIRVLRELHPAHPCPEALRIGTGFEVCPAPDARDAVEVRALLEGHYWWPDPLPPRQVEAAHAQSDAWLVVRDRGGAVVASARALSDGVRLARVCDVVVRPALRGQGLGTALMRTLLDHPRLRHVQRATLGTRDAHSFYRWLGFSESVASHTEMQRLRTSHPPAP